MKTAYYLIAALSLATAGAAIGAENTDVATTTTASTASVASAVATVHVPKQRGLTRAEVQAQVIEARKNGTLIETEADMDVAQTRKHYAR